jgi:hypothetical protein
MYKGEVICPSKDDMEDWQKIGPVLADYARKSSLEIHVSNPHGRVNNPQIYLPHTLWVKFWSVPSKPREFHLEKACGYPLHRGGSGDSFKPTGKGIPIRDGNRVILAEVVNKNNIYVLFDLPHLFPDSDKVLKFILDEYDRLRRSAGFLSTWDHVRAILGQLRPTESYKHKYFNTFLDPKTGIYYRDRKEIERRWRDLIRIAYGGRVYVIDQKIFVPLGRKIMKYNRNAYITLCLDVECGRMRKLSPRRPFSETELRTATYSTEGFCLGNVKAGVSNFLGPKVREDALAVLTMREYFRQGNS